MDLQERDESISPRVRLARTEVEVSRLGFGTSGLMSRVGRRDSLVLLGAAFDEGITHFDTARSYGYGEAESVLGDFLQHRREQITITTKVGIIPPPRAAWLSAGKAATRALISALPAARKHVRHRAARLMPAPRFDTAAMTQSFETSLRALRTGYVDFLLLHEPSMEVLRSFEPLAFLQRVREQGKVRLSGVATDLPGVLGILAEMPEYATVLQHPYAVFPQARTQAGSSSRGAVFVHSCLGSFLADLRRTFDADSTLAAQWSRQLEFDMTEPGKLEQLILLAAMRDMPEAAILFSSTQPQHIRENAAALKPAASSDQVERFRKVMLSRAGES